METEDEHLQIMKGRFFFFSAWRWEAYYRHPCPQVTLLQAIPVMTLHQNSVRPGFAECEGAFQDVWQMKFCCGCIGTYCVIFKTRLMGMMSNC